MGEELIEQLRALQAVMRKYQELDQTTAELEVHILIAPNVSVEHTEMAIQVIGEIYRERMKLEEINFGRLKRLSVQLGV